DKVATSKSDYMHMVPKLLINAELKESVGYAEDEKKRVEYAVRLHMGDKYKQVVSAEVFHILKLSDGEKTLEELCEQLTYTDHIRDEIYYACIDLWSKRLIGLSPCERVAVVL